MFPFEAFRLLLFPEERFWGKEKSTFAGTVQFCVVEVKLCKENVGDPALLSKQLF